MRTAICLVAILGCTLGVPTIPLERDWSQITPKFAFVEPINDITYPSERVVGGYEVVPNSHQHQVALIMDGRSFCGGSLISQNYVLTAAHCTNGASSVEVTLGAHNVRQVEATQLIVTSRNLLVHAQYSPSTLTNDVSLVRLPTQISLNANIQTITLAPANSGTYAGSIAHLTGWGRVSDASNAISPTLQGVSLPVISNTVCASTYGTSVVRDSTICTSGAGTVGACNGDSGGPLVVESNNQKVQVGVASFVSSRGCNSGLPTGYARVSAFTTWIIQNSDL